MSFKDLFVAVPEWTAADLRAFLAEHHPRDYQLIDVRQLKEYGEQHLPGAHWLPIDELSKRLDELDQEKPTIVYCSRGMRSRAAVQTMRNAGFRDVHSLQGGLHAWQGELAGGLPQVTLDYMRLARSVDQEAVLAWWLEEHTRQFYDEMAETLDDPVIAAEFAELAAAESHHKSTLKAIWEALTGRAASADFPQGLLDADVGDLMEGGMHLREVLAWAAGRPAEEILELAMAIETNAFDHYIALQRTAADENVRRLYELLIDEERRHLQKLSAALETLLHRH